MQPSRPPSEPPAQLHASLIPEVLGLAQAAGRVITELYRQHHAAAGAGVGLPAKGDGSPLTQADLAAHRLIEQGLLALRPEWSVVSEEGEAGATAEDTSDTSGTSDISDIYWLVDPLDGTREFLAGNGEFTVNIALVRAGTVLWGVVCAPALDQSFWGGRGLGAWQVHGSGTPRELHVAPPPAPGEPWRVVTSRSHLDPATQEFIQRLGATQCVQAGSSLKFCLVAQGQAHVYPRLAPTCHWDTAAAQAVLEGAGGCVLDLQGRPLRYLDCPGRINPGFVASCAPIVPGTGAISLHSRSADSTVAK